MPEDEEGAIHDRHAEALIGLTREVDPKNRFAPEEMMGSLPEKIEPGTTFVVPFREAESTTGWKATFTWQGGSNALFQLEMIPGQSLLQDPLADGWVSWKGPGTLVAWAHWESDMHGWGRFEDSPLGDAEEEETEGADERDGPTSDPLRWQHLANLCLVACTDSPQGFEGQSWL